MSFFSYSFILMWSISVLIYYTIAKNRQWYVLLIISVVFYLLCIKSFPLVLILITVVTFFGTNWITCKKEEGRLTYEESRKVVLFLSIVSVGIMFGARMTGWVGLFGNSYFTLKAISYMIDANRDEKQCENNLFQYILFLIYLPTISQGPFNRYKEFRIEDGKRIEFDYVRFMHGIQRVMWGAFKKIVLTVRLQQVSNCVFSDIASFGGIDFLIGAVAYTLWFYMDFSGYMDIAIGVSETFGLELPENFRQPFFSKSVAEFWRRWHITLGTWFRDYIMIPFVQSKTGRAIKQYQAKKHGKESGRLTIIVIGTIFVWIGTALWHGMGKRYLLWGMYYCVIICVSLISEKPKSIILRKVGISNDNKILNILKMVMVWGFVLIANIILFIPGKSELRIVAQKLTNIHLGSTNQIVISSALNWHTRDYVVLIIGLLLVLIVSIIKEKGNNVFFLIDKQVLPIRWLVYYAVFFSILWLGIYESTYDSSAFFYAGF